MPCPSSGCFVMTKCVHQHKAVKGGKLQKPEPSLICVIIAEGSKNALPVSTSIPAHFCITISLYKNNVLWSAFLLLLLILSLSLSSYSSHWLVPSLVPPPPHNTLMVSDVVVYIFLSFFSAYFFVSIWKSEGDQKRGHIAGPIDTNGAKNNLQQFLWRFMV